MEAYEKLTGCYDIIKEKLPFRPKVGLILGSGLGDFAEEIEAEQVIEYKDIEGFPMSTVAGHKGRFIFGRIKGVPVVMMQGRVHYYEGYQMSDVVLPVRLMGLMGIETLFLTNAAGGINFDFTMGDFMVIRDQITCYVPNPLVGPNLDSLGERFPDMTNIYNEKIREKIFDIGAKLQIPLKEGVYIQLTGPSYESPAEIKMFRTLGADAAGMSTGVEAIAARHMGIKVCGISCITNLAAGMSKEPLSHMEVQQTADRVAEQFKLLVTEVIGELGKID